MKTYLHTYDLPNDLSIGEAVAIDTETMGLNLHRDRLCVVQLTFDAKAVHLVHFPTPDFTKSRNLKEMLLNNRILKIFHFARFDVATIQHNFGIQLNNIYCTKIASHLVRTFTGKHGLKDLCKDLLGTELAKEEQTSDWGSDKLHDKQINYAANDVLHLHALKIKLDAMLIRENRTHLARATFDYLPYRCELDLLYGQSKDIMAHKIEGE